MNNPNAYNVLAGMRIFLNYEDLPKVSLKNNTLCCGKISPEKMDTADVAKLKENKWQWNGAEWTCSV